MIKKPVNGEITIDLPESLADEEVEVIVLPVQNDGSNVDERVFNPAKYRGALKVKMSLDQVERECKEMRDEWNRDF